MIWKLLLGQKPTLSDLAFFDTSTIRTLDYLRKLKDSSAEDRESYESTFSDQFFTCLCCDGGREEIDLIENGHAIRVTFERRLEYADLIEQHRLHQFDTAVTCILEGFNRVVPTKLLQLFKPEELEVCGHGTI